jgi:hypothetical protein
MGLLLPFVAGLWNLDRESFAREVLEKAGLSEPPYAWCRFDCATWLADSEDVWPTIGGFASPQQTLPPVAAFVAGHCERHVRYLLRHLREDGTFFSSYQPFHNRLFEGADPARQAHGAWVLARAHKILGGDELRAAAGKAIDSLVAATPDDSTAEISFLLLALGTLEEGDPRRSSMKDLAAALWRRVELPHGRIATHKDAGDPSLEAYQDYFPGQVLLALADACGRHVAAIDEERLERSFRYYRHRFRYKRHFGQVAWLLQACSKWWHVTGEPEFRELTVEIADWLLGYQQEESGGFINDHQPGTPGYTTAVYLEGMAAALAIADGSRRERYFDSCARGFRFLDRLIIQERDRAILPNPDYAIGGLRQGLHASEVRTDFVQHSLSAMLEFTESERSREAERSGAGRSVTSDS